MASAIERELLVVTSFPLCRSDNSVACRLQCPKFIRKVSNSAIFCLPMPLLTDSARFDRNVMSPKEIELHHYKSYNNASVENIKHR